MNAILAEYHETSNFEFRTTWARREMHGFLQVDQLWSDKIERLWQMLSGEH